jgi:hypothetical protein
VWHSCVVDCALLVPGGRWRVCDGGDVRGFHDKDMKADEYTGRCEAGLWHARLSNTKSVFCTTPGGNTHTVGAILTEAMFAKEVWLQSGACLVVWV